MIKRGLASVFAASLLAIGAGCAIPFGEIPFEEHLPGEPPKVFTVVDGTVESVRPTEIIVRLQDGNTIVVAQAGSQGFAPGQRVRVVSGADGSRLELAKAI